MTVKTMSAIQFPPPHRPPLWLSLLLIFIVAAGADAQTRTTVTPTVLDPAAFRAWADGQEQPVRGGFGGEDTPNTDGPKHVVWTSGSAPEWDGSYYGVSKNLGVRYLRIGFQSALPVGTVLTRGGGTLSVLKATAAYPGRLNADADWVPARRVKAGVVSTDEAGMEDYAVWTLPAGTTARALRFAHTPQATDTDYAGWLGGVYVLSPRAANLAPLAVASAGANNEKSNLLNDDSNDGTWNVWENASREAAKDRPVVSPEHPETVSLTWRRPVKLSGLCALGAGFGAGDAQVPSGPADAPWQTVKSFTGFLSQYPRQLGPNWIDFGRTVTTRAVRLRITKATDDTTHPHLNGTAVGGRRVWLAELLALSPLGSAQLASVLPAAPPAQAAAHPPIPIPFTLATPGYVSLVIDDAQGRRVRNLISETYYPKAGANVAWWDGQDDLGRDSDAAHHGLYHVPGRFVAPGAYTVHGLVHPEIGLAYEFSVYNAGHPAWETQDRTGGWLTNHTPPQAVVFAPDGYDGKPAILIGSFVSEGGSGLAWTDLDGRKVNGVGHVGGSWTGAAFLARDAGAHPAPDAYAYAAAPWSVETYPDRAKRPDGEIRLTALTPHGDRPLLRYVFTPPARVGGGPAGNADWGAQVGGLAVRDGLLVVSLPTLNRVLFVDAGAARIVATATLDDPRGLAFDSQDRLLALSGTKLLRFALPPALRAGRRLDPAGWAADASVHVGDAAKALDGDPDTRWSTNGLQTAGQWFRVDMKAPQTFSSLVLRTASEQDSPHGYQVFVSGDGQNWGDAIASGAGTPGVTAIYFPRVTARYVKVLQTGTTSDSYWSLNALDVYDASPLLSAAPTTQTLPAPETLVASGLEDPRGLTLDSTGSVYVSDRGNSHQVKVFSQGGTFVRAIGHPGVPKAGPYDVLHLNNPAGLAIDSNDHLWVAEADFQPKRVSVWTLGGKFVNAFYGPSRYGGGGTLDPQDKSRFYYDGMEFKLDWATGENHPASVFFRPGPGDLGTPDGYAVGGPPETPLYVQGRQYLTNCYSSNPTNGVSIAMLWRMKDGIAVPVAALGRANDWSLLKGEAFKPKWPQGATQALFVWSDTNGDGQMQPDEVTFIKAETGGVTVLPDLSFVESRMDDRVMRYAPTGFTDGGVPEYDLAHGQALATGAQSPASSGGDQALAGPNGWLIAYPPPKPFSQYSVGGLRNGIPIWSYPNLWPGLHAGHEAPTADHPGELLGTTRLLGGFVTPRTGDAGPVWALNGNFGDIYLMTEDGLFVSQLFQDVRRGKPWTMPAATRGMRLNDLTLHDENFFPSLTQTPNGRVYLVSGGNSSLVRVDGLDRIKRLPARTLRVSAGDLKSAEAYGVQAEAQRQKERGTGVLTVSVRPDAPTVDGKLDDWAGADWATIDKRGVGAWFDSNSKPYDVSAALAVSGDRLYAAFKTGDRDLLRNSADNPKALFKFGGALDLMLGVGEGGERLLVTQVKGKTLAMLYRPHVPGTKDRVPFSSPSRTVTMDRVDDVSERVTLAGNGQGDYEFSVPLQTLGLSAVPGRTLPGDVGILRGDGSQTLQRVYWNNKATGITADVPSEAELTPQLWGTLRLGVP